MPDKDTHVYCTDCIHWKDVQINQKSFFGCTHSCSECICNDCNCYNPEDSMRFENRPKFSSIKLEEDIMNMDLEFITGKMLGKEVNIESASEGELGVTIQLFVENVEIEAKEFYGYLMTVNDNVKVYFDTAEPNDFDDPNYFKHCLCLFRSGKEIVNIYLPENESWGDTKDYNTEIQRKFIKLGYTFVGEMDNNNSKGMVAKCAKDQKDLLLFEYCTGIGSVFIGVCPECGHEIDFTNYGMW